MNQPAAHILFRILCAGLMAPTAADIGRTLYQWASGFPPVNWSITGRWFLMVLSGQAYVPGIAAAPSLPHELIAGHAAYYTISMIFAAVYLIGLAVLGRSPSLANGLAFGLATMAFPFLVQMPLMGMGIFAIDTATPGLIVIRTLIHHSSFGIGLALGALLADRLFMRRS
jgi:hypothetical protein